MRRPPAETSVATCLRRRTTPSPGTDAQASPCCPSSYGMSVAQVAWQGEEAVRVSGGRGKDNNLHNYSLYPII